MIKVKCSNCGGNGYLLCNTKESRIIRVWDFWGGKETCLAVNCSGSGKCTLRFIKNMDLDLVYIYKPKNIHVHPGNICLSCKGRKIRMKKKCWLCDGSGICPVCMGTGKCTFCNGTGKIKCKTCNGKGYKIYTEE